MRYTIPTLIATALLAALAAQAGDIYRWKDANGTWHYADQPVPGAERVNTSSRAPQADASEASDAPARKSTPPAAASAATSQIAAKVHQDLASRKADQCKQATEAYEQAISARRLYKQGANGEPEYLDDDQVEAHRVAARSEMETLCAK